MGKARRLSKTQKAFLKKKIKQAKKNNYSTMSNEEILTLAKSKIETYDYEEAQALCQEVLKRDADDLKALEVSASLCLELGNKEGAMHCFGRAITLAPDSGFTKYLSMGELLGGEDGLQCYKKGIELIQQSIQETQKENIDDSNGEKKSSEASSSSKAPICDNSFSKDLIRKLSNAYCSIADLYTSDLCDADGAEQEAETYCKKATECDSTNPEAYIQFVSSLL